MGHNDRERRRLALQATILNPLTDRVLERAGIGAGLHVLDIGCGVGEVSMLAARRVGPAGRVIGIDMDAEALTMAEASARRAGLENVEFRCTRIEDFAPDSLFDAVTCRHVLIHTKAPLGMLQAMHGHLRDGGVAVCHEFDFAIVHPAYPPLPIRDRLTAVFREFFRRVTYADIGTRLYHLFLEAGFTAPDCRVEYAMDGGVGSPFYEWAAESFRSVAPAARQMGLIGEDEFDVDTLAERLEEEAVAVNGCFPAPPMVGGFARKGSGKANRPDHA